MKSRWSWRISLLTAGVLALALLSAGAAMARVDGLGGVNPDLKASKAVTDASTKGVRVKVLDLASDVAGFDVYRSGTAGVLGAKLNKVPVTGDSYLDATAAPGVTYHYTVKVAGRAGVAADRYRTADTLGQVAGTAVRLNVPNKKVGAAAAPAPAKRPWQRAGASASSVLRPSGAVFSAAVTYGASGVQTLTANTTWSPTNDPIYVRGDLVVPTGKTLTIKPGTKIYFDTAASGNGPQGTKDNPTNNVDLIVHGKIVAAGSSTAPITFTSIRSLPASGQALGAPQAGDWGTIFIDSNYASSIYRSKIDYGLGVWAKGTSRPTISYSSFNQTGKWGTIGDANGWGAAVLFDDPPKWTSTMPRVKVWRNKFNNTADGVAVYTSVDSPTAGDAYVDPYIAYNTFACAYAIDLEAWRTAGSAAGHATVKGTITGNRAFGDSWEQVYLYADSRGWKTAAISTALSGNTLVSGSDDVVYAEAYAYETGSARVKPTFSGDKLSGYSSAFYGEAYSNGVGTAVGNCNVEPKFTNCTMTSINSDTVYLYADSANNGAATTNASFVGGSVESEDGYGVYGYTESENGPASSSPTFSKVYGGAQGNSSEFLYLEAYGYGWGAAKCNPRWVGGSLLNYDDTAIYLYADSKKGSAEARPYLSGTKLVSYYYGIEAYAYGSSSGTGNGYANVSGTVLNSKMSIANYDSGGYSNYYAYASSGGTGAAVADPVITGSTINASEYCGLELYADSVDGKASCSPVVTGSNIRAYSSAIYAEAERSTLSPTAWADAVCSPKLKSSTLSGQDAEAVALYADNNGIGNSYVSPDVRYCTVVNDYYDGAFYLEPQKSSGAAGTAQSKPYMLLSDIRGSDDYAVDVYVTGPGAVVGTGASYARFGGKFDRCTIENPYYDAIESQVTNYDGKGADTDPTILNCTSVATDDNVYEMDTSGSGAADVKVRTAPVITGGSAKGWGSDIDLNAENRSGTGSALVSCEPKISGVSIYASGSDGISTDAYTDGDGKALNNTYVYKCPTYSDGGISAEARAETGNASASNVSKILGASAAKKTRLVAYDDSGVALSCFSENGESYNNAQVKYLSISSYSAMITVSTSSDSASSKVTGIPTISDNKGDTKWVGDDDGIHVVTIGANVLASPVISYNTIPEYMGSGISVNANGSVAATISPTVYKNTITGVGSDGINVGASNATGGSYPSIRRNVVTRPWGVGISISKVPNGLVQQNTVTEPGLHSYGADPMTFAGIAWNGATASAKVRGNMVTGSRAAVAFDNGAATTQWNSFADGSGGFNAPFNYATTAAVAQVPLYDARYNYWATSAPADTIYHPSYVGAASSVVDYTGALSSRQPKVTSIKIKKYSTKVKFTVKFDRPMDTAIKTLRFGRYSPYRTYKVTGTWSSDGMTFTGTRKRSGLPTGKWMYFSGAKDLPGNTMFSKSKGFKL